MQFKQYFPDKGLTHVIALTQIEWNNLLEWIYTMTEKHQGEIENYIIRIQKIKNRQEGLFLNAKDPWDQKIINKLNITEPLGFVGREDFIENYHITKRRYEHAKKETKE
jgi:hypothetical protein